MYVGCVCSGGLFEFVLCAVPPQTESPSKSARSDGCFASTSLPENEDNTQPVDSSGCINYCYVINWGLQETLEGCMNAVGDMVANAATPESSPVLQGAASSAQQGSVPSLIWKMVSRKVRFVPMCAWLCYVHALICADDGLPDFAPVFASVCCLQDNSREPGYFQSCLCIRLQR